jgi:SAM-dependent methyltransferase
MKPIYDDKFYRSQADGSARSASVVVPIVLALFRPKSVVDVGCGTGSWALAFSDHGVADYVGVDGDYVDRSMLRIPDDRFKSADLQKPIGLGRRFDLACSLEVAEHLPPESAEAFVAELTSLADVVLFSAAIPNQGGMDHVNEQWPTYWAGLFAKRGYIAADCIRPRIYGDPSVEWWYQQNILVFCKPDRCPSTAIPVAGSFSLNRIHPQMLQNAKDGPFSGKEAVTAIKRAARVLAHKIVEKAMRL